MFCKHCGWEVSSNSNFCSHCGEKIEVTDEFVSEDMDNSSYMKNEQANYSNVRAESNFDVVDRGTANIGWCFLGFVCPIAGWILGSIYAFTKPDLAYKCRRGAWFGFIFDMAVLLLEILLQILV